MSTMAPFQASSSEADPEAVLRWAFASFPRLVIVASFQAESSVLIDMASRIRSDVAVLTLDTGRLPQETHDMIDRVRDRYAIEVQVVAPDPEEVRQMVALNGTNLFYQSAELRRLCCGVRKSRPLERAIAGYDAWLTGLRRSQMETRSQTPIAFGPGERVWEYIRTRNAPSHRLYDGGHTSRGWAPCTGGTGAGEDARAGRWWWEHGEVKECGLHWTKP